MKYWVLVFILAVLSCPVNSYSANDLSVTNLHFSTWPASNKEEQHTAILREILDEAARYCERLKDLDLAFTCTAEIEETIYHPFLASLQGRLYPHTREHNQYLYQYHFKKVDDLIEENWTLSKENGVTKNAQVPGPSLKRFYAIWPIYGPLEFLSRFSQSRYVYKIKGNTRIENRKAYVIEASPLSPGATDKDQFIIWMGVEDTALLKIVWNQSSLDNPGLKSQYADPKIELSIEYFEDSEGIRLPTKYSISEEYQQNEVRLKKSKTTIIYGNYDLSIINQVPGDVHF